MSKTNSSIIETHGLTKFYGSRRGVLDLEIAISKGEIFGFLGPNGAGKTTTIRLLLGLIKPSKGNINILGEKLSDFRKAILNNVGYLPGDFGLYPELSGRELIRHLLKVRGIYASKQTEDKLEELIQRFGFNLEGKIKTYSKGMKQIIGIIQAFCHNPRLVIMDEPTSGLDPLVQGEFYRLLDEEKQKGVTIFLSSHILKEVERICDRVGIVKDGKLVYSEELKTYRSLAGKKITLDLMQGDALVVLNSLKKELDIDKVGLNERRLEFFYKGDMQKLLEIVKTFRITDILIEVPTLDDFFLSYYSKEAEDV